MSIVAAALDDLVHEPRDVASSATSAVIPTPSGNAAAASSAPVQVGDHDARALGGEALGDRAADALRRRR